MNILYHHRTRGRDVEGVHIREIVKALTALGNDVIVLSPPGVDPLAADISSSRKKADLHDLKMGIFRRLRHFICFQLPEIIFEALELLYNFVEYFRLCRVLKDKKIDLIYERYSLNNFCGRYAARRHGIPIILEINDATFLERVRHLKLKRLAGAIERRVFNKTDALIVVSGELKKMLLDNTGVSPEKVHVIPNACDIKRFDPARYSKDDFKQKYNMKNKIIAGYVGAFVYWHGLPLLAEIMPELAKAAKDLHFLFVGSGQGMKDFLGMVERRQLSDSVTFVGRVPHNEIPRYMSYIDIGVIPASNNYGSPMKLFEYMSMGVIPVAPKLGPIEEIVRHGTNGFLFKPGDARDMKDRILEAATDARRRKTLSLNARKAIVKNHQWQNNAEKVLGIYRQIKDNK